MDAFYKPPGERGKRNQGVWSWKAAAAFYWCLVGNHGDRCHRQRRRVIHADDKGTDEFLFSPSEARRGAERHGEMRRNGSS